MISPLKVVQDNAADLRCAASRDNHTRHAIQYRHSTVTASRARQSGSGFTVDQDTRIKPGILRISLYLNGAEANMLEANARIDDANFGAPTVVGEPGKPGSKGRLSKPLLLSAPIEQADAWSAPDLHREMCADLAATASED